MLDSKQRIDRLILASRWAVKGLEKAYLYFHVCRAMRELKEGSHCTVIGHGATVGVQRCCKKEVTI